MCEGELCTYIFGYGSLMWRPGFPYLRKFDGYIKGWKRVFWQGSTDHRGTPSSPGRVVTLTKQTPESRELYVTWGVVYCIPEVEAADVLKSLDYREKGGYIREEAEVYISGSDSPVISGAIVYLADHTNQSYLGDAPLIDIASQIVKSVGPSGPNVDYLLNLANVLRTMNVTDDHVFELESHVRLLMERTTPLDEGITIDVKSLADLQITGNGVADGAGENGNDDDDDHNSPRHRSESGSSTELRGQLQRKYLTGCSSKGTIMVDNGAMTAVSNRGKSLLAAGILGVQGVFLHHDLVNIADSYGRVLARGYPSYGSEEIEQIKGKHSKQIIELLGFDRGEAVVLNQNMILV